MSILPATTKYLIAGHNNTGIKVRGNSNTYQTFLNIESLSKRDNYWALQTVKTLHSLSSGYMKSSVFVDIRANNGKAVLFDLMLPGCKASVIRRKNGEMLVFSLEPNLGYFDLQRFGIKAGLHTVKKVGSELDVRFIEDGNIKDEKDRIVAITDYHQKATDAADIVGPFLSSSPIGGSSYVRKNGFDMHFTPSEGKDKIGRLTRITQALNAETDPELRESAMLLAQTMENARKVNGVRWISERGGSGILTQAMRILRDKGIQFDSTEHLVFFAHITTNIVAAESLAREIGLKFDRATKSINYKNPNQALAGLAVAGAVLAAVNRFKQDPEHSVLRLGADIVKEVSGGQSGRAALTVSATAIAGAVGFTIGGGGTGAAVPAAIMFASAAFGAAKFGSELTESWLTDYYNKIKGRF